MKVKAAMSAHSLMADVIPFFNAFNIPFESNASIKPTENIFYTQIIKKTVSIILSMIVYINVSTAFGE